MCKQGTATSECVSRSDSGATAVRPTARLVVLLATDVGPSALLTAASATPWFPLDVPRRED